LLVDLKRAREELSDWVQEHPPDLTDDGPGKGRMRSFVEVMKAAMALAESGEGAKSTHLLLALVSRQDTVAGRVLARLGVTEEKVLELISTTDATGTLDEPPEQSVEVRIGKRVVQLPVRALSEAAAAMGSTNPEAAAALQQLLQAGQDRAEGGDEPDND
jgi:ATP-dependent Clp protease ATP-binding subunit ClpA